LFKESPVYTPNLWNTTIASLNKKVRDSAKILKKMLKSNYEDLDKAWANNAGSENNTPPKQKRTKNRRAASEASDARSEDKTPLQEKQKENYGTVSEANEAR